MKRRGGTGFGARARQHIAATKLRYRENLLQQHVKDVERHKRKLAKKEHKARMVRARAVKTERGEGCGGAGLR